MLCKTKATLNNTPGKKFERIHFRGNTERP